MDRVSVEREVRLRDSADAISVIAGVRPIIGVRQQDASVWCWLEAELRRSRAAEKIH